MSAINNVVAVGVFSFTFGLLAAEYPYDHHWWNYLQTPAADLKSKVPPSLSP